MEICLNIMKSDSIENPELKNARRWKWLTRIWMILIPLFGFAAVSNLYRWQYGKADLSQTFSALMMICVGLSNIFINRNKILQFIFIGLSVVFFVIFIAILANR